jgi:DNA-binding GntR family transcriptional regulator
MELIDREDHQKLYMQLYEILRKKIESKEWAVGSQIPTEEDLCKMFSVSRATVRTAVMELVRQGYLRRQQGKGTFIFRNAVSEGLSMLTSLKELLLEEGVGYGSHVLARTVMMPVDGLHTKLGISEDKHVIYIKRLWTSGEKPVLLQEIYIPYHICPLLLEDDIEGVSLFDLFERKYGIKITKVDNFMETIRLEPDQSLLLESPKDSFALLLTQIFYSGDTLIMYMRSLKRQDRLQLLIELERKAV